jgi:quinohemoprotein ethanol dehydrogenase
MTAKGIVFLLAGLLLLGAVSACQNRPDGLIVGGDDWPMHGRTSNEERFSPLNVISSDNVRRLGLIWSHEFDTDRGQEATPIMVDGTLYISTAWSKVYALDARTGRMRWQFDPQVPGPAAFHACCDVVNRGVAVSGGRVFVGTLDGRLIALDARTGKTIWSVLTVDPIKPYTVTGAPRVARGKVIIGNSGAEFGVRGYVTAYDVASGRQAWRFYTVPGDPAAGPDNAASDDQIGKMRATWFGRGWIESGGGGTVWDSIVYDEELNRLYIGVGNGSPHNYGFRSDGRGDNLFLSSIVALDPDTGRYIWHYQEIPGESWDWTATQNIILTTLDIAGKPRKVMMQAPKNGLFYVIDRETGVPISADPYAPINWFKGMEPGTWRPRIDPAVYWNDRTATVLPGQSGIHNWQPMAFSPRTGLVYIPVQRNAGTLFMPNRAYPAGGGAWKTGFDVAKVQLPADKAKVTAIAKSLTGALVAWDPVAREIRWAVEQPYQRNGGTLATNGNLVFQGMADGHFIAYAADDGRKLWDYDTGNGIVAPPITYRLDGRQYVAVLIGFGGTTITTGFQFPQKEPRAGRLMVFGLDGQAKAPPYPAVSRAPLTVREAPASPSVVEAGAERFAENCMACHGVSAIGGTLPDLRYAPTILDRSAFGAIVAKGALSERGMIGFEGRLSPSEIESIRLYIQAQARAVR